jgi:hypothetical protein
MTTTSSITSGYRGENRIPALYASKSKASSPPDSESWMCSKALSHSETAAQNSELTFTVTGKGRCVRLTTKSAM